MIMLMAFTKNLIFNKGDEFMEFTKENVLDMIEKEIKYYDNQANMEIPTESMSFAENLSLGSAKIALSYIVKAFEIFKIKIEDLGENK